MYRINIMTKREKIETKWNSLLYNHLWLKYIIEYGLTLILTLLSAAIFAFGLKAFIRPYIASNLSDDIQQSLRPIASGGTSGISQVTELAIKIFSGKTTLPKFFDYVFEYMYIALNIPLLIFAYRKIGKRFATFTLINVVFVSLFSIWFNNVDFINKLAQEVAQNSIVSRALFAGLCTGMSSAIAFKIETSAGGFDIIGYYFSLKKNNNTGPYVIIINSSVLVLFTVLSGFSPQIGWAQAISGVFYSIVYLFTATLLIDLINIRNKKTQIEIITNDEKLPERLMAYIPHGATLLKGKGVYSGQERFIVHMVVSTTEVKKVIKIIKQIDPTSFVGVTSLQQVYGNFHMKPIK